MLLLLLAIAKTLSIEQYAKKSPDIFSPPIFFACFLSLRIKEKLVLKIRKKKKSVKCGCDKWKEEEKHTLTKNKIKSAKELQITRKFFLFSFFRSFSLSHSRERKKFSKIYDFRKEIFSAIHILAIELLCKLQMLSSSYSFSKDR